VRKVGINSRKKTLLIVIVSTHLMVSTHLSGIPCMCSLSERWQGFAWLTQIRVESQTFKEQCLSLSSLFSLAPTQPHTHTHTSSLSLISDKPSDRSLDRAIFTCNTLSQYNPPTGVLSLLACSWCYVVSTSCGALFCRYFGCCFLQP